MKKRILILAMAFATILPCAFLLSACGNKNYSVNINVDGQYLYLDMFGSGNISFKKDELKNSGLTLYGYDVYDYSELKVLVNGEENSEIFSQNDNSGTLYDSQIKGEEIQIGTFVLGKINEDVTITISGAKEKEVSFAFMRADDERLGENKPELSGDQTSFDENYEKYVENYSTKLEEKDYQYFEANYANENIANSTTNGYTSVDWLFKDNKDLVLYENEEEDIILYQPYEFKYNASEFFNRYLVTYYSYITPDGIFTSNSDGSPMENLPSGTKEYKYQKYVFTNGILNTYNYYDTLAIFEIFSDKKYGYYNGVKIKNHEYNFENYNSYDGILTNYGKDVEDVYKPLNKDNITVEQLRKQSNYVFELYEKNLFVFDFSNMNVKEKNILINYSDGKNICSIDANLSSDYGDGHFGSYETSLEKIGGVDEKSTFYITNLPNKIEGVSGIDFSNAEILINGTKLEGNLGSYEHVPADNLTGKEEHFICTINKDVVEVDFYTKERLLDADLTLNNDKEKFVLTIQNIDFENAKGLSKVKATDNTQSNLPSINDDAYLNTNDDTFLNPVYSWNEGNTVYAYVQTGNDEDPNKILVSFNPSGGLDITKTPKVSINKGGDIKEIDIMAQINKGLADQNSLQDWVNEVDQTNSSRNISWSEDGYKIEVSFYLSEIDIQYLSTINIQLQLDVTYTNWLEMNCEFI